MNATNELPKPGYAGHTMTIEAFEKGVGKGFFMKDDVWAFWATDTHFDPSSSVWLVPRPPEATKVVLFGVPLDSAIIPPTHST